MRSGVEHLQAQVEEMEALQACYPAELELADAEAANIRFATLVAAGQSSAAPADVPALSGTLTLPGVNLGGGPVLLKFVLPKSSGGTPSFQVLSNAARQDADSLQQLASSTAADCAADDSPALLLVADRLAQAVHELAAAGGTHACGSQQRGGEQLPAGNADGQQQLRHQQQLRQQQQQRGRELTLSRRTIWFHHIKNLTKRKSIVEWGRELGLGGYSKPGFPGIVLVEGAGCDIDEYLSRLRRLRWQAMAVRAEEDVAVSSPEELEAARQLPRGVQELGEEDMGRLAAAARAAGLESLFLAALKLGPAS